jgi:hypothetical protein
MHSIKEFGIIDNIIIDQIIRIVKDDNNDFDKSLLYSTTKKEKFVDENERTSSFKLLKDEALFDKFEKLLEKISSTDKIYDYMLVRNDVTYIKYDKGGFFKKHADYLSFTSNLVEEYTMILCIDANCKGGETKFHINPYFEYSSKASITPKNCVIFRKDLVHEGCVIQDGYKNILTVNLLAFPKKCEKIIEITFANEKRKKILKYNDAVNLGDNLISRYINNKKDNKIIKYTDEICCYEDFEILERIYTRNYIEISQFIKYKNIIDHYNIDYRNILMLPQNVKITHKQKMHYDNNSDIVLFDTETDYIYNTNVAKKIFFAIYSIYDNICRRFI